MNKLLKYLCFGLMLLFVPRISHADSAPIEVSFGDLTLKLPFQTVNAAALWDFVHKQGEAGLLTPFGTYKHLVFNGGAITSISGHGAPLLDIDYLIANPTENFMPISSLSPGIYGGYDFNAQPDSNGKKKPWIVGVKLSVAIW
jgi:hypothetical protein